MSEKRKISVIDDSDVAHALERVRRGHAGASDTDLLAEYIAGLKAIIQKFQAGSDDPLDFDAGAHTCNVCQQSSASGIFP